MSLIVNIVSAEESIFSGEADMVVASAEQGEVGIRQYHAPLLTFLKPGHVRLLYDDGDAESLFYVSSGYLEVQPHVVTILADTAERAKDIDEAAAQVAEQRAREALVDQQSNREFALALTQLSQASAKLSVIRRLKKTRC